MSKKITFAFDERAEAVLGYAERRRPQWVYGKYDVGRSLDDPVVPQEQLNLVDIL